ncbi:flagellar hook-basal body complex protein [Trinickia mobilis]|uniref:flagellar hook-basal body complex protein n=1 Tax=Trinickia mobilis TaxID=2816356 RepID=UPI001A8F297C|nr:flagellar hook-basal body complex protein [Trinickia mobilis]
MSFDIALSGINAVNGQLNSISNNIANTGTFGFKAGRANFAAAYAGMQPSGVYIGSVTQTIDIGGNVLQTGRGMDAAIQGKGFFVSKDSDGSMLYSRVGIFSTDKDGFVVDSFGRHVQGYSAAGGFGDMSVPTGSIPAKASGSLSYVGNMSADWTPPASTTFDKDDAQSFNSSVVSTVYDSLGREHSVTQYFVKKDDGSIDVHYTMDGGDLQATSNLTFDENGKLTAPTGPVALDLGTPDGAAALVVNLDYAGTTQYAGDMTTTTNKTDGYQAGSLTDVSLDENGSIIARYSNGQKETVGQVALATFPDDDGLQAVDGTCWKATNTSGTALYGTPGTGLPGKLTVGALEQSNVDMTSELVNLTTAQRNYQANSKVISTESQMMQALMQAV